MDIEDIQWWGQANNVSSLNVENVSEKPQR